ncbi:MAG: M penetrans family 1 protein [Flavobacteriales bacterium]|nr:M penetrans family 1 protein [Flavobacteriales bacterium]
MKKVLFLSVVAFGILFFSFGVMHDFYTSMTKVEYSPGTKLLKFASKIDVSQLEKTIPGKLSDSGFENSLKSYLNENISVTINGKPTRYEYTGKQESGDILWVYYQISDIESIKSIGVKNTLFFSNTPNQQNFVSFNIAGKKSSFVCTKGSPSGEKDF